MYWSLANIHIHTCTKQLDQHVCLNLQDDRDSERLHEGSEAPTAQAADQTLQPEVSGSDAGPPHGQMVSAMKRGESQ